MAENPRFNNSDMFTNIDSNDYSEIKPDSKSEVLATQGNVINSIKVFWNNLKAKLAYAVTRPNTNDAVGGNYQPVYIDENGVVQVCAPETITANIESGSKINIGNIPVHPGKTICVRLSGSFGGSALPLKIGKDPVIYPSGAPVYSTNVNSEGTYLFTYMAGGGNRWILISSMNVADGTNNGLMTADEHNKLAGIDERANAYSLPTASATVKGGVKSSNNTNTDNLNKRYHVNVDSNGIMTVDVPWVDTHEENWEAKLRVGFPESKENNETTGDQETFIKVVENGEVHGRVKVVGSGSVQVSSTGNGVLEIKGGTIPSYKKLGVDTVANGDNCIVNGPHPTYTDKYFLNAKGGWTQPTVTVSMGKMAASVTDGTYDQSTGFYGTLKVTYNGSPIQFALLHGTNFKVSNSSGQLLINGLSIKANTTLSEDTTALIVPMGNLSLKPQILHFISKDSVEFLD